MSTETKVGHTPGPWRYEVSNQPIRSAIVAPNATDQFGTTPVVVVDLLGTMGGDDTKADARLIAAAPDLLAAAARMESLMENLWKAIPWGQTFGLDIQALNEAPMQLRAAIRKATEG